METGGLVSVIIPVYNVLPYLAEAIDSVINQTYEDLEIIIIDDGSTDGSGDICEEYAQNDSRIRVVHQENKGLSSARNIGLDAMTGEMVVFVDSDDACRPDYVEAMMKAMNRDNSDLVVCRFTVHNTTGKMKRSERDRLYPTADKGIYTRIDALRLAADGTINPGVWNKLYKSALWKDIRFPEGHVYENVDTTYRVVNLCSTVCVIDEPLYMYRKRQGAITEVVSAKNVNDWLMARSHFEDFIKENIPDAFSDEHLRRFYRSRLNQMISFYVSLSKQDGDEEKTLSGELRKRFIELRSAIGLEKCSRFTQIGYWMTCFCPWLLKIAFPVY